MRLLVKKAENFFVYWILNMLKQIEKSSQYPSRFVNSIDERLVKILSSEIKSVKGLYKAQLRTVNVGMLDESGLNRVLHVLFVELDLCHQLTSRD